MTTASRPGSGLADGSLRVGATATPRPGPTMPLEGACSAGPGSGGSPSDGVNVMVVFVDQAACPWLRLLKRGFRHCFAVLRAGPLWVACEPLKDRIDLDVLDLPPGLDLARFYAEQGHRVLLGRRPLPRPARSFALAPLTCVTVVKRLLAIQARWVCTPAQLHAHLLSPACGFHPCSMAVPDAVYEREAVFNGTVDIREN